ncbi:MAG: hypothetical protein C5B58_01505 [Acidobacteria bacterium]|nr:MAG: hypothetical protein C5B58_01505 [Acidobacteriota bacterium]
MPTRRDVGQAAEMGSDDDDHEAMFIRDYERYKSVKERGEAARIFALRALVQLYDISGGSGVEDRDANIKVMQRLLDETDVEEKYDQLRRDALE